MLSYSNRRSDGSRESISRHKNNPRPFRRPLGIGPYKGKQNEIFQKWNKDIVELAKCENVYAKLGGVNMDVNGFAWHERKMPPVAKS